MSLKQVHTVIVSQTHGPIDKRLRSGWLMPARGYLLKGANPDEVLRAITAVGSGEAIFSPSIATRLITFFAQLQPTSLPQSLPELTEREHEILILIAQGRSNGAIAKQLSLSTKTVSNYVSNILSKLQVADRTQAALRARQAGLG